MQTAATKRALISPGRVQSFLPALLVLVSGVLFVDAITVAMVLAHLLHGQPISDWIPFYSAGELVRSGHAAHLYDVPAQAAAQRQLFGDGFVPMGYALPAFAAYAFAPLSRLSFVQSYFVWLAINLAALAVLVRLGWSWLQPAPAKLRVAFLAGAATLAFVLTVLNAQVDLFVLAGMAGCYALLRADRPITGGSLLAIALLKPHLAIALLLLLLVKRQWRALAGFIAIGAPLLVVPALLSGPHLFADQAHLLLSFTNTATDYRVNADTMINIRGPVTALTGSSNVWLWLPLLVVIAAVGLYVALRVWRERPALHPHSWALAFALPLLYSPHVHIQTVVLLFAAAGLYLVAALPRVTIEHVLAAFVAVNAIWLLTIAGIPLMAFGIMAAYALFAQRWPEAAAPAIDLPARAELALAS